MEVEVLPDGIDGILFVFDGPGSREFWMLNTPMPLDIWWFGADMQLLSSTFMEPCQGHPCPVYRSPGPVQWALETPADRFSFEPGDLLDGVISAN